MTKNEFKKIVEKAIKQENDVALKVSFHGGKCVYVPYTLSEIQHFYNFLDINYDDNMSLRFDDVIISDVKLLI